MEVPETPILVFPDGLETSGALISGPLVFTSMPVAPGEIPLFSPFTSKSGPPTWNLNSLLIPLSSKSGPDLFKSKLSTFFISSDPSGPLKSYPTSPLVFL